MSAKKYMANSDKNLLRDACQDGISIRAQARVIGWAESTYRDYLGAHPDLADELEGIHSDATRAVLRKLRTSDNERSNSEWLWRAGYEKWQYKHIDKSDPPADKADSEVGHLI